MREKDREEKASPPEPERLGLAFERLAGIMARLRSPEDGCPWDLQQTPDTLARHLVEEAYEAVEAIGMRDWEHLREELGDVLLEVVFQSRIAEEEGRFTLCEVVDEICEKLERRHPHIFGDEKADSAEEVLQRWEKIKGEEGKDTSIGKSTALPPLLAAWKVQRKVAREGFDWAHPHQVVDKLLEEIEELEEEMKKAENAPEGGSSALQGELGDLLFTCVNLARHLGVDPDQALKESIREFTKRYEFIEAEAKRRGIETSALSLEEKDRIWENAKKSRS
ncbi:MAG: nucleoside triphosphate pyrophosphohydrolase [Actinomycetota bacterium]|nr:nucleoside triphosphate pyrophosphohydrolase [Actinomycetota bacterium]